MTETDWGGTADLRSMLEAARAERRGSDRRCRLLGCACVRLVWSPAGADEPPEAVAAAEGFADGQVTRAALRRARRAVRERRHALGAVEPSNGRAGARWAAYWLAEAVASEHAHNTVGDEMQRLAAAGVLALGAVAWPAACALVRDVFGPFPDRDPPFAPAWRTATSVALARGVYEERAFERLPILADALTDAGCTDADVLAHCRGAGPHARGCWVVDQALAMG